jgi:hypothetical protein
MIAGDERDLLAATLHRAAEEATGEALDAALDGIGWRHALAEDTATAVALLFEAQGRHGATSSALDAVMAHVLGAGAEDSLAVALPALRHAGEPGMLGPDGVGVHGLGTRALGRSPVTLVACAPVGSGADGGAGAGGAGSCVAVPTAALAATPLRGLDPDLGLVAVDAEGVQPAGSPGGLTGSWVEAVRVGRLALSHELVGASRSMLQLARDHAVERVQFGRPIAEFQAVRHRLAEAYVAVESAEAATASAWQDGSPLAAAAAKAIAGRNAQVVARHAQQVLAGIGFTTEHPLHLRVRRVLVLDGLLGDARSLTRAMGEELLASRRLPPLVAL